MGTDMSKAMKLPAAKPTDASYWKTTAVIIAILLLLAVASLLYNQAYSANRGVAGNAFAMENNDKNETVSDVRPKFVDLGTFTANMSRAEGDQNLQASISLKLTKPGLEEKIKASIPEIQHHVNMVLQSKRPSELLTYEDKEKLAQQIKQHVEYVVGFRRTAPSIGSAQLDDAPTIRKNGISDVLFTSFIIQY